MDQGQILCSREGNTLVMTLYNPEHRNALGPSMYQAATTALTQAQEDKTIRCVILTGHGEHFCAGGQLQRLQNNRQKPPEVQAESIQGLNRWILAMRQCPLPILAATEGAVAGAGLALALACDAWVSSNECILAMSYVNVGLSPDGGSSWHLARLLPRALALEIMMTGQRYRAESFHTWGLINQVVPCGTALTHALQRAKQLAYMAPNALASIKQLTQLASNQDLEPHLVHECEHFVNNLHHPNAEEGIAAFLEKRHAIYNTSS